MAGFATFRQWLEKKSRNLLKIQTQQNVPFDDQSANCHPIFYNDETILASGIDVVFYVVVVVVVVAVAAAAVEVLRQFVNQHLDPILLM
jgi:hypothetical protein